MSSRSAPTLALPALLVCLACARAAQAVAAAAGPGGAAPKRLDPAGEGGDPQDDGVLAQRDLQHGACSEHHHSASEYLACKFGRLDTEAMEVRNATRDGKHMADQAVDRKDGSAETVVVAELLAIMKEARDIKHAVQHMKGVLKDMLSPSSSLISGLAETEEEEEEEEEELDLAGSNPDQHGDLKAFFDSRFDLIDADARRISTTLVDVRHELLRLYKRHHNGHASNNFFEKVEEQCKVITDSAHAVIQTATKFKHELTSSSRHGSMLMRREVQARA